LEFTCDTIELFDVVLFTMSLHHLQDLPKAIQKTYTVLKEDGLLVAEEFSRDSMNLNTAIQFYDIIDILESAKLMSTFQKHRTHAAPSETYHTHDVTKSDHLSSDHTHHAAPSETHHTHVAPSETHHDGPSDHTHVVPSETHYDVTKSNLSALQRWNATFLHHQPLWTGEQMLLNIKSLFDITFLNQQIPYLYRLIYWYWVNKTEENSINVATNVIQTFFEKEKIYIEQNQWVSVGLRIVAKKKLLKPF